jgi:hypothetical protein
MTTPEEFAEKMRNITITLNETKGINGWDEEDSHKLADQYMCDLLIELGYGEGVDIFKGMHKYYA